MTTTEGWHPDPALLEACAHDRLPPAADLAVESHLAGCATCRANLVVPDLARDELWAGVRRRVATPRPGLLHRLLVDGGVDPGDVVLVDAAGALRIPWALSLGGSLAVGTVAGQVPAALGDAAFLLLAPLVPVLAVVAAYDATDTLRELSATTSHSRLRVALVRTLAVLLVALPSMLLVSLAVPVLGALAWVWLLPSLGLTSTTLALIHHWPARLAGGVVAGGWAVVVSALAGGGSASTLATAAGQGAIALATTALVVALIAASRHPARPTGGRR